MTFYGFISLNIVSNVKSNVPKYINQNLFIILKFVRFFEPSIGVLPSLFILLVGLLQIISLQRPIFPGWFLSAVWDNLWLSTLHRATRKARVANLNKRLRSISGCVTCKRSFALPSSVTVSGVLLDLSSPECGLVTTRLDWPTPIELET